MDSYVIKTDGYRFECQSVSVDDAIKQAFDGDGIIDIVSLHNYFNSFNGRCTVTRNGKTVTETGSAKLLRIFV